MPGKWTMSILVAGALLPAAALAAPVDATGTGGGPASAAKAPYTASTGATVPRPGAVQGAGDRSEDMMARQDRSAKKVLQGICIGCSPK